MILKQYLYLKTPDKYSIFLSINTDSGAALFTGFMEEFRKNDGLIFLTHSLSASTKSPTYILWY